MRSVRPAAAIAFQPFDERQVVDRDVADDHGGEVGIFRQEPAHRLDEQVAAFLLAHPAERPDAVCPGRPVAAKAAARSAGGRYVSRSMP